MSVLLTGGSGYIGSHTAVELLNRGYEIVIADDLSNSSAEVIDRIERICGKRPVFYKADVCDKEAVRRIFSENDIKAVIHFAGYKAVGESVAKPVEYYRNNLDSTLTLLEVMKERGCTDFVFSSSATVYGESGDVPFREDSPSGRCTNPYGFTKAMQEQILRDAAAADPELSVVLLRYFNPVGAHESGLIGEDPKGVPNNLMPYIGQVAAGQREKLYIFGNDYDTPDGTGVRDYIHVCDLAAGHAAALDYAASHKGAEVFNLGTGRGFSVLEMVKAYSRVNGVPVPYEIAPRRPGDIAVSYADPSKAERLLGWKAERGLDEICRDAYRFAESKR